MDVNGAVAAIMEGRVHDVYLRYLWKCLEVVYKVYEANSTPERTVMQGTIIIDLEGFSMYQFASPKGKKYFIYQSNKLIILFIS